MFSKRLHDRLTPLKDIVCNCSMFFGIFSVLSVCQNVSFTFVLYYFIN